MKTRYTCVGELASLNSLNVAGASSLDVRQVGRTTKQSNVESFTTCMTTFFKALPLATLGTRTDYTIQFNICIALVNALLLAN